MITYLIKQSYFAANKDRINEYIKKLYNEDDIKIFNENELIKLRPISITNSSIINLSYHVESEKLFVIKSFINDDKLKEREINNYMQIKYPFIPKFYGKIKNKNNSFAIEFINGRTLYNVKKGELDFEQKMSIIIEILYTFLYLHSKSFLYRDLKPNNLILDKNNRIVLIDFDQMIDFKNFKEDLDVPFTRDFASDFTDPKMNEERYIPSFKNDIYSIGKIISFVFTENSNSIKQKIDKIVLNCTDNNLNKRPSLSEIIKDFKKLENNISLLNIVSESVINQNDCDALNNFGDIYYDGKYVKRDINKSIYYFTLAAKLNNIDAQNSKINNLFK